MRPISSGSGPPTLYIREGSFSTAAVARNASTASSTYSGSRNWRPSPKTSSRRPVDNLRTKFPRNPWHGTERAKEDPLAASNPNSTPLNYSTTYTYDALDDLQMVTQAGVMTRS